MLEEYKSQLTEIFSGKDRDHVDYLFKNPHLDSKIVRDRHEREQRPYLTLRMKPTRYNSRIVDGFSEFGVVGLLPQGAARRRKLRQSPKLAPTAQTQPIPKPELSLSYCWQRDLVEFFFPQAAISPQQTAASSHSATSPRSVVLAPKNGATLNV
jgi:hypothetical protein